MSKGKQSYTVEQFRRGEHLKTSEPVKKKSKYNAIKKTVDNITFHSSGEADRYVELKLLHDAGEISLPILQYRFLLPGGVYYVSDFFYFDYRTKEFVVEDFKGVRTAAYKRSRKIMKNVHGITILETSKKKKK